MMTCLKITESQNGKIYPEDTFSHGAAQMKLKKLDDKTKLEYQHVLTDRQGPFVQPSWLSYIEQYTQMILGNSLMKVIHICNLEEIG